MTRLLSLARSWAVLGAVLAVMPGCAMPGAAGDRSADASTAQTGSDLLLEALGARPLQAGLLEPKVIGGAFARQGDDPWQVALVPAARAQNVAFCGGSLVSPTRVVTAAHCVDNGTQAAQVAVISGSISLDLGTRSGVTRITVHPGWNPATKDNDVAVLQLAAPAAYAGIALIEPADEAAALQPGTTTRVSGWGAIAMGGGTIRDLKYVEVPVVDRADCNDTVSYGGKVTTNMVCAGFQKGGTDSCQGDSGGPLTVAVNGQRILAGVVSWGQGCALPNKYGVYTRLANYRDWIARLLD